MSRLSVKVRVIVEFRIRIRVRMMIPILIRVMIRVRISVMVRTSSLSNSKEVMASSASGFQNSVGFSRTSRLVNLETKSAGSASRSG